MAKRKQRQPTRAELAAEAAYAKMMAKWDKVPKFASSKAAEPPSTLSLGRSMSAPPGRETRKLPSRVTPGGVAELGSNRVYTGDKMIGIATLHKSISQPIFSQEEATDVARMRR